MKNIKSISAGAILIISLIFYGYAYGSDIKWFRLGAYQDYVVDTGARGHPVANQNGWYYTDNFTRKNFHVRGWHLIVPSWEDPESGDMAPYKQSGAGHGSSDELEITMPLPDEEGLFIHRYLRYQPPTIEVDGFELQEPFPRPGDEVNPDVIPGNADQMVTSHVRTDMGVDIETKILGYSQKNHDDYLIFWYTFTNTGNVDLDEEVEKPNQVLEDLYFWKQTNLMTGESWLGRYGQLPGDSLRVFYGYFPWSDGASYDDFGRPDPDQGHLQHPEWIGEATLYADESIANKVNDQTQPKMTGVLSAENNWFKQHPGHTSDSDKALLYQVASEGLQGYLGTPEIDNAYPGTHHTLTMENQGHTYPDQHSWWTWRPMQIMAYGPYTLQPGESFSVIWAEGMGSISPQVMWDIGKAWLDGTAEAPPGYDETMLPPPASRVYDATNYDQNDKNKDMWVASGKDSLFQNFAAAQWAADNGFEIPTPPPPPSISVTSLPDNILIEWSDESESASDFAGYRVYRARGNPGPAVLGNEFVGSWEMIFETTTANLAHSYEDNAAQRGQAYYYSVVAFDDGVSNQLGFRNERESLESSKYVNMSTQAAHLTREAQTLDDVRVVPNPYNIAAQELQFTGEPDKIMFMGLPPECTIRIYTMSGDLIKTIEHTDGSGDEPWGRLSEEFSATSTGQLIVSGVYIAHIETPDGENKVLKFVVVR